MKSTSSAQHLTEIENNRLIWDKKPVLQKIYFHFYGLIKASIKENLEGKKVELGCGIGKMKWAIPELVCTDIFQNPWVDQVETAYNLSFPDESVSNLILFDVFHHLEYPGDALNEFSRVLKPGGRVIIFEPYISMLGLLVYGVFHAEPVGLFDQIKWHNNNSDLSSSGKYYAAQGNATRIFFSSRYKNQLAKWNIIRQQRLPAIYYILSGGFSKSQLYPDQLTNLLMGCDRVLKYFPYIFATRVLIVIEKK